MSRTFKLGDVIAESYLTYAPSQGAPQAVTVRIGRPVPDVSAPHETWLCPYQVEGIGDGRTLAMFGVDAMQALILTIHTIPAELGWFIRHSGGQFLKFGEPDSSFIDACRSAIGHSGDLFPPRRM